MDAIEQVRAAELKAEETLRTAQQGAQQLKSDIHDEAVRAAASAEEAAQQAASGQIAAAHKTSQKKLEENAAQLKGALAELEGAARERQPEAIQSIIGLLA